MPSLHGKTIFITGASRGIGRAIGVAAAREGANVVVAAKSDAPNPKLPGTIQEAAQEIEARRRKGARGPLRRPGRGRDRGGGRGGGRARSAGSTCS